MPALQSFACSCQCPFFVVFFSFCSRGAPMTLRKTLSGFAVLTLLAASAFAQDAKSVEWGKYLVTEIGKCQDCHTPRTAEGKFDESKWMKGSVLNLQPITPINKWHK